MRFGHALPSIWQTSSSLAHFVDGELIGTTGFVRESGAKERHKGRLWGVYLSADLRGKGVGRSMMKALLDRASSIDGLEQIVLAVATQQAAAIVSIPFVRICTVWP